MYQELFKNHNFSVLDTYFYQKQCEQTKNYRQKIIAPPVDRDNCY